MGRCVGGAQKDGAKCGSKLSAYRDALCWRRFLKDMCKDANTELYQEELELWGGEELQLLKFENFAVFVCVLVSGVEV